MILAEVVNNEKSAREFCRVNKIKPLAKIPCHIIEKDLRLIIVLWEV
jgi:hypothetical protein